MFHYNGGRNHQGVNSQLLTRPASVSLLKSVRCCMRLSGMLNYQY